MRGRAIGLSALILATGGLLSARAVITPASSPVSSHLSDQVARSAITVVTDPPVAHPAAGPADPPQPAALPAWDRSGFPHALPGFNPPGRDICESQPVAHPVGFTQMGGSGTDTVTQPDGSSTTFTVDQRHAPLQWVCLSPTGDGGVDIQGILQPVLADASTYEFTMTPSGVTLVAIDPGRAATVNDMLPVNQRLAGWPTSGCGTVDIPDLGPRHASIHDTFCFSPNGQLRHVDLHEKATGATGVSRDLEASLDLFQNG